LRGSRLRGNQRTATAFTRPVGTTSLGCALIVGACLLVSPAAARPAAPPNDNFASAAVLSGTAATATGTNIDATKEPGEPEHAGQPGGRSVWWRWTAPAAGGVTIDACDSSFDTVLAVYTGTSVDALIPVKSNDDTDACDFGSSVTFVAVSGQVYSIAVDGNDEEEGEVGLRLQPTLRLDAKILARQGAVDAIRFVIQIASAGEDDFPDAPTLVLERGGRRQTVDLELENELDSETRFRFTFEWSCDRRGAWRWTVSVRRDGERIAEQGAFTVRRCVRRAWFVPVSRVVRDFRADFGADAARALRCQPVGSRRGSLAPVWRCVMVRPGFSCTGSFLFRYSRVYQGSDVVSSDRDPSGRVTCRG
jgi:hypothetical protein